MRKEAIFKNMLCLLQITRYFRNNPVVLIVSDPLLCGTEGQSGIAISPAKHAETLFCRAQIAATRLSFRDCYDTCEHLCKEYLLDLDA